MITVKSKLPIRVGSSEDFSYSTGENEPKLSPKWVTALSLDPTTGMTTANTSTANTGTKQFSDTRVGKALDYGRDSGLFDLGRNLLDRRRGTSQTQPIVTTPIVENQSWWSKQSTGTKVAIGIGAVAVVGTVAYLLMKKK